MQEVQTFLRIGDVQAVTGLARSTLYELIANNEFPKPVPIGKRSVAWLESEIIAWQRERIAQRGQAA